MTCHPPAPPTAENAYLAAELDRSAEQARAIDLDRHQVEGMTLEDGHDALLVDGGGLEGGNAGDDLHAVGSLAPIVGGSIGCIVVQPGGSRYVARAVPDPLAE